MRAFSNLWTVRRSVVGAATAVALLAAGCTSDDTDDIPVSSIPDAQTMSSARGLTSVPTAAESEDSGSEGGPAGETGGQDTAGSAATSESVMSSGPMASGPTIMRESSAAGNTSTQAGAPGGAGTGDLDVNSVDLADQQFDLSWQDALDRARQQFEGDVTKVELEVEGKVYGYKVELMSDMQKFEYQIDANTGDVLDQETDDLDKSEVKTERQSKSIDLDGVVSVEEAMKTALGEQNGRVKEWKIEGKSTGPRYEFDIEKPGSTSDVEIKVDAVSGEVIRTP